MSIIEVARSAGVSTATVSRVLNAVPGVRGETARRVWAAVDAVRYDRERVRRGPRRGSRRNGRHGTGNIAVITVGQTREWLQLPVMASVVAGIGTALSDAGYQLILSELTDPMKPHPLIERRQVDGAIVFLAGGLPAMDHERIFDRLRAHVPVVWAMGMEVTVRGVDHVSPDNIRTGYLAHGYLRGRGCEHMAFVTTDPLWQFMRLRGQSFLNACFDAGAPGTAYLVTDDEASAAAYGQRVVTATTAEQLVAKLAAANPRPTGLFICNDQTTARLYPLLSRNGLQPGRDVTVVSCDNEEARLSSLHPRPATIDIGPDQIGARAVVRLRSRIERPDEPTLAIHVAPRLVDPDAPAPAVAARYGAEAAPGRQLD